jgi:hypothetical protein
MPTPAPSLAGQTESDPPFPVGSGSADWADHSALETRLRVLLEVSHRCRAPMSLDQLVAHLPAGATWTTDTVSSWIDGHPEEGHVVAGHVMPPFEISVPELVDRTARSQALLSEAQWAVRTPLRSAVALARCVGVSGSVAYGYAAPGDDLDFFVTARRGTTWLFLALAFLSSRRARQTGARDSPTHWCFNYVIDEAEAPAEFARPGGLLLAREALSVRVVRGDGFYRKLLLNASWMSDELPQMYARRLREGERAPDTESQPRWGERLANFLAYPFLATYPQMAGLVRNHRLRREAPEKQFSTTTQFRRYMLRSERFEELERLYRHRPPA